MTQLLGACAALSSSCTWAYASTRYAQASRSVGSVRVNLARATIVSPIYFVCAFALTHGAPLSGYTGAKAGWLALSVLTSYTLGDGIFFFAASRLGISTALSIASIYPLWAALAGVVWNGEPFGATHAAGTLLCVVGVAALVRMAAPATEQPSSPRRRDLVGVALAVATSLFWATTSVAIKRGAVGLSAWQVNALRYPLAMLVLLPVLAAGRARGTIAPVKIDWRRLLAPSLADGVFGSLGFVYGLSHTDLAVGATLTSLAPLVSVPVAIVLGEERWSAPRFAAVAATVGGVAILVAM